MAVPTNFFDQYAQQMMSARQYQGGGLAQAIGTMPQQQAPKPATPEFNLVLLTENDDEA